MTQEAPFPKRTGPQVGKQLHYCNQPRPHPQETEAEMANSIPPENYI